MGMQDLAKATQGLNLEPLLHLVFMITPRSACEPHSSIQDLSACQGQSKWLTGFVLCRIWPRPCRA